MHIVSAINPFLSWNTNADSIIFRLVRPTAAEFFSRPYALYWVMTGSPFSAFSLPWSLHCPRVSDVSPFHSPSLKS